MPCLTERDVEARAALGTLPTARATPVAPAPKAAFPDGLCSARGSERDMWAECAHAVSVTRTHAGINSETRL